MDYTVPTTAGSFVHLLLEMTLQRNLIQMTQRGQAISGYCSHGTQIIEYLVCGGSCESSDHGTQILH